jgi:hypothetical protein
MKNKGLSTVLSKNGHKSLSKWNEVISEAKERIAALKRSIRTFQDLRDSGMKFPEPSNPRKSKNT